MPKEISNQLQSGSDNGGRIMILLIIIITSFVFFFFIIDGDVPERLFVSTLGTVLSTLVISAFYLELFVAPKNREQRHKQQEEIAIKRGKEIFSFGKASKEAGVPAEANPYNITEEREMWLKGYINE